MVHPQLLPVISYEGQLVGRAIAEGIDVAPDYGSMPFCVYSIPMLASVGRTEAEARQQNLDLEVKVNDLQSWRSARTYVERSAYSKILIDRTTDRLVGAHILRHGGEETINLIGLAMKAGLPASELRRIVFADPTFGSDLRNMVQKPRDSDCECDNAVESSRCEPRRRVEL